MACNSSNGLKPLLFPIEFTLTPHNVLDNGVFTEGSEFMLGVDVIGEVALKMLWVRNHNSNRLLPCVVCTHRIANKIAGSVDGFKGNVLNEKSVDLHQ